MNNSLSPEKHYLRLILRWSWFLIGLTLLAAAISYFVFHNEPILYEAQSQILIGPGTDTPDPDLNALRASEHLMQTYRKLASTDSFINGVISDLKLQDVKVDDVRGMMDISTDTTSLIMTISARSKFEQRSIDVANGIARGLVRISPNNPENSAFTRKEINQAQAATLETQMKQSEERLASINTSIKTLEASAQGASPLSSVNFSAGQERINSLESGYVAVTNIGEQSVMGVAILQEQTNTTLARISQLQADLDNTDANLQPIVLEQINAERDHLSGMTQATAELQRLYDGQPLDIYIQNLRNNIKKLQDSSKPTFDITSNRFIFDQITESSKQLSEAETAAVERQQTVLTQLTEERKRLSAVQSLPIEKRRFLNDQMVEERTRLDDMQKSYAALNDTIYRAWTNQAQIAQPAVMALPVASNFKLIMIMAAIGGLTLGLLIVLAYGFFNNSLDTASDLEALIGAPILGTIEANGISSAGKLVMQSQPNSVAAEQYRQVIARLLPRLNGPVPTLPRSTQAGEPGVESQHTLRTLLVSGISAADMTGDVVANLGLSLAETGRHVLIVDADMHEPVIAKLFKIKGDRGFTNNLSEPHQPVDVKRITPDLAVLPSGPVPQNAFRLATSTGLPYLLERLRGEAWYVLIAGAPLMAYADALMLADYVDGIILVSVEGEVDRNHVENFVKAQQNNHWNVVGIVAAKKMSGLRGLFSGMSTQQAATRPMQTAQSIRSESTIHKPAVLENGTKEKGDIYLPSATQEKR